MANSEKDIKIIQAPQKLKALFIITVRNKFDFYQSTLEGFGVNMIFSVYAKGTLDPALAQYVSVLDRSKVILLFFVPEDKVKAVMNHLEDRCFNIKANRGIAFTIPLDSMMGLKAYQIISSFTPKEDN